MCVSRWTPPSSGKQYVYAEELYRGKDRWKNNGEDDVNETKNKHF